MRVNWRPHIKYGGLILRKIANNDKKYLGLRSKWLDSLYNIVVRTIRKFRDILDTFF